MTLRFQRRASRISTGMSPNRPRVPFKLKLNRDTLFDTSPAELFWQCRRTAEPLLSSAEPFKQCRRTAEPLLSLC